MQTYIEKDFITIEYNQADNTIISKWITPPTSNEFREGMEGMLQAITYFKTGKLISDTIHLGALHPHDQQWAASEWYMAALKAGFSHNAIIVPQDIFTEMSVEGTLGQIENMATIASFFESMEAAIEWIKQF